MNEQKRDALVNALNDRAAAHPMWIGDDGEPLDYLPEREARIGDFVHETVDALLPLVDTWLAEAERRVTNAVEAALRLIAPDHITPMGARQVKKAMEKAEGER